MDYFLSTFGLDPRITRLCAQQDMDAWCASANAEPAWSGIRGEEDVMQRRRVENSRLRYQRVKAGTTG